MVDFDASTRRPRKGLELAPRERPAPGWGFTDRFKTEMDTTDQASGAYRDDDIVGQVGIRALRRPGSRRCG